MEGVRLEIGDGTNEGTQAVEIQDVFSFLFLGEVSKEFTRRT